MRIDEKPRNRSHQEQRANEKQRRIPVVVLLQPHDDQRTRDAADLAGGIHRGAHDAGVTAADIDDRAPGRAEGEHARRHRGGDAPCREFGMRGGRGQENGGAGDEVGRGADTDATDAQAKAPRGGVRGQSAEQISHDAQHERQTGEESESHRVEAVLLPEIVRQPGDAEVEAKAVRKIHEAEEQRVAMSQQLPPIGPAFVLPRAWIAACDDLFQLRWLHRRMLLGIIAKPAVPGDGPHDAGDAKDHERPAPPAQACHRERDQRCQSSRSMRDSKEDALDRTAFGFRDPA